MAILRRYWSLTAALVALAVVVHDAAPAHAHPDHDWPEPPQDVQVEPGDGKLTLTWSAPSSWRTYPPVGYQIDVAGGSFYGSANPPGTIDHTDWEPLTTVAATATSYTFTGTIFRGSARHEHTVTNGTKYHLRVRAVSAPAATPSNLSVSDWVAVSGTPEPASMTVAPTSLTVPVGSRACYVVRPNTEPTAALTVTATSSDTDKATVAGADVSDRRLSGSVVNWRAGYAACVKGVATGSVTITNAVESDDTNYDEITTASVSVTVTAADTKPTVRFLHSEIRAVEGSTAAPHYGSPGRSGPGPGSVDAYDVRKVTVRLDIAPAPSSSGQITWIVPHPSAECGIGGKCFNPGYTGSAGYNIDFVAEWLVARQVRYTSGSNDMQFDIHIRMDNEVEADETVRVYVTNRQFSFDTGIVDNDDVCVGACDSDTSDIDADWMTLRIIDDDAARLVVGQDSPPPVQEQAPPPEQQRALPPVQEHASATESATGSTPSESSDGGAPGLASLLPDRVLYVGYPPLPFDVSGSFTGTVGTYRALSDNPNLVGAAMTGSRLSLSGLATGVTTVTVSAANRWGAALQTFRVTVRSR